MALFNKKELNYEDALVKLEKEGRKGFNALGSAVLGAGIGAAAGVAAAGTIAGAAGVTSIAGLTTAASWIGVTAVAATPVGWVVGSAVGLGAAGAGVAAWWNLRTINAENAKMKIENIHEKIKNNLKNTASADDEIKFKQAINVLRTAHMQNLITKEQGQQLLTWLKEEKITPEYAMSLIDQQCAAGEKALAKQELNNQAAADNAQKTEMAARENKNALSAALIKLSEAVKTGRITLEQGEFYYSQIEAGKFDPENFEKILPSEAFQQPAKNVKSAESSARPNKQPEQVMENGEVKTASSDSGFMNVFKNVSSAVDTLGSSLSQCGDYISATTSKLFSGDEDSGGKQDEMKTETGQKNNTAESLLPLIETLKKNETFSARIKSKAASKPVANNNEAVQLTLELEGDIDLLDLTYEQESKKLKISFGASYNPENRSICEKQCRKFGDRNHIKTHFDDLRKKYYFLYEENANLEEYRDPAFEQVIKNLEDIYRKMYDAQQAIRARNMA